ncbi:predicted protein [Thalassiosira pseudonana CCMP1335]|uniref:ABC1 atypical kinase-like domain-containing protein n=1 Tax=Thalassiosira pseudonana TaxID=35128 RepID=B8C9R5_THAPS|nr:predicted protein [Thalassiosira pseudonana CCMP1335]EED89905.1 predicted protein [Thalassiosira pseudonana CCMP1335]
MSSRIHYKPSAMSSNVLVLALLSCAWCALALVPSSGLQIRRSSMHTSVHRHRMVQPAATVHPLMQLNAHDDAIDEDMRQFFSSKLGNFNGTKRSDSTANTQRQSNSSTSLFAKRTSKRQMTQTIPSVLFMLLRRVAFGASVANAVTSATATTLSRPSLGLLRSIPTTFLSSLRHPTKQTIRTIVYSIIAVVVLTNIVESVAASKRQKLDATSEWGRYADKPSARGMALFFLMLKLTPYAVLPSVIEKLQRNKIDRENDREMYESSRAHQLRKKGGNLFADGLLRLGPLYIKIGQILSCRENLFPEEWIGAMEKLQDRVPAKSGQEAWELAYAACPGGKAEFHKTYSGFNDIPLAAASLGQVHKATLRSTGERVAIKIQRARLRDIYDKDLALMKQIAKYVDKFGKAGQVGGVEQSWTDIFSDAETILYREIDYRDEAENARRFANDFGLGKGGKAIESTAKGVDGKPLPSAADWLRTPYTYGELSSEKWLVMEYVPSIKVNSNAKLDAEGVTVEDREYLAEALAHSYLRQFCVNKFFSTDPHPGNLGIEVFEDKRPPRLVFYDFGQACSLSEDQAGGILEVIESIIDSDAKKSVKAFVRMGVLKDNADLVKVQAKCHSNYDTGKLQVKKRKRRTNAKYSVMGTQRTDSAEKVVFSETNQSNATNSTTDTPEVKDAEVMEFFTLQSEYAFVARALSQLDGVGKGLDPEFDFISASAPYLVEIKGSGRYIMDEVKKKLDFVFGEEGGVLTKEMNLFKALGFEPESYQKK